MADDLNELPNDIARALRALDADAESRARRVSADRVAERVLQRLRDEPAVTVAPPKSGTVRAGLRIAAAMALLVMGVAVAKKVMGPATAATAALPVGTSDIAALDTTQMSALLTVVESSQVSADTVATSTVLVEDLNAQELERLLQTLEGETL